MRGLFLGAAMVAIAASAQAQTYVWHLPPGVAPPPVPEGLILPPDLALHRCVHQRRQGAFSPLPIGIGGYRSVGLTHL